MLWRCAEEFYLMCRAADATKRPSFGEVLQEMKDLVRELPSRAAVTDAEFQTDENPSGS